MDLPQTTLTGTRDGTAEQAGGVASPVGDHEDRAEQCRVVAGLYCLLGRCLEEEVDAEFLALVTGPLRPALMEIGLTPDDLLLQSDTDDAIAGLAEEFTALFVAPGAVSPYRSVFETGCTFQEPCDQVVAAYREAGLEFRNRYSGEFPDHVGVMLGFVGWLAEREVESLAAHDESAADAWRVRRETFLLEQLGPWAPGWCHRARILAQHAFYRQVLELTERVLWQDLQALADRRRLRELERLNRRAPARLDYDADFRKASGL